MSRPKNPVPLVTKIARVFASVERLQRKGTHERGFRYTRAHDVFELVRGKLLAAGILVCPVESPAVYVPYQTNGGETWTECRLQVTYTFQDALSKLDPPLVINGCGRSIGEEALEIAQTKAQKALLKRFGIMADEQDDAPQPTGETTDDAHPAGPSSRDDKPVTMPQIQVFKKACVESGRTDDEIMTYLFHEHHVTGIQHLSRGKPFTEAMRWAARKPAPKPQAVPLQGSLPLPKPAPSFEMKVGGRTETVEAKTGSYSV
jgi:hypothetical protein